MADEYEDGDQVEMDNLIDEIFHDNENYFE